MQKKESIQQTLKRVRPPRVQITYDVEIGGAIELKEVPSVVEALGDFSGQSEQPLPKMKDRKITEVLLAVELEKRLSKQQILTLYCNLSFVGHGNYGMEAAARDYFGHGVGELTLTEAATLAGIVQRPSDYSPIHAPERLLTRRNYVLRRMLEEGFIDRARHDAAVLEPMALAPRRESREVGAYFGEAVRRRLEESYGRLGS